MSNNKQRYLNSAKTIPEVFSEVKMIENRTEKIERLKCYRSRALAFFVNGLYNEDWSELSIPEYKPNPKPVGICFSSIHGSITRIQAAKRIASVDKEKAERLLL